MDIAEYEIKERRSKVVPLNMAVPNMGANGWKMVEIGRQWNAVYAVPEDKTDLIPKKGDIAPGFARSARQDMAPEELERAKHDDLFIPRVKNVTEKDVKDGKRFVVIHIAQAAPFEGVI